MHILRSLQRKYIASILLVGISTQALAITFQEVGDRYLNSYSASEQPTQLHNNQTNDPKKEVLNTSVRQLSIQEQRRVVFSLLSQLDQSASSQQSDNAIAQVLQDLAVLQGQPGSENISLTSITNYCTTVFGEAALANMLAQNISAHDIQKRQALIKELITNDQLFDTIEKLLFALRSQTNPLLSLWAEENKVTQDAFKKLYFSNRLLKTFNTSPTVMEGTIRTQNAITALVSSAIPLFSTIMNYVGQYILYKKEYTDQKASVIKAVKAYLGQFNPYLYINFVKDAQKEIEKERIAKFNELAPRIGFEKAQVEANQSALHNKNIIRIINYINLGGTIAVHAYQVYIAKNAISSAIQQKNTINYLQARLIGIATLVNTAKSITQLAQHHQILEQGVTLFADLSELFASHENKQIDKLVKQLQKNTFKGNASFFSISGRVLAANKLMENNKQEFARSMLALGELDACLSIAKMMKEFQQKRVGYCFVEFIEHETPYLKLDDFWNPFINANIAVTNSIEFGGNKPRAIIVTGSNTGGKSTNLKAIMTSILLARTFGIAPARNAVMTQFAYLGTSMNVSDNTATGDSLFQAEVKRAETLVKKVESLRQEFGCLIIDELFTGTGPEKGAKAAKRVAAHLAKSNNIILILSTHFPEITNLEQETGLFKNYKVDVYKDEHGNLVRPFKLEPGISNSNIADDILNQRLSFLVEHTA